MAELEYYPEEDVLYLHVAPGAEVASRELHPDITAELGEGGILLGIEMLKATDTLRTLLAPRLEAPDGDDAVDEYDFSDTKQGLIRPHPGQTRITLWVDTDVYEAYMAYAARICRDVAPDMNTALRLYIEVLLSHEGTETSK